MDLFEVVKKRKAVRKFRPDPIPNEVIKKILAIVNLAPSAGNIQAYKIFVVKDEGIRKKLARKHQDFISTAPVILIFCAHPEESAKRYGERGFYLYALQDATIAATFSILVATSLGLASCWVGAFNEKVVQEILATKLRPVALIPIGYPAEDPVRPERKTVEKIGEII